MTKVEVIDMGGISRDELSVGAVVRLVPTEGVYQKDIDGRVARMTKTLLFIQSELSLMPQPYRRTDGMGANDFLRSFPRYRVEPAVSPGHQE